MELFLQIMPRKIAVSIGLTRYVSGVVCIHGHFSERGVHNRTCETCKYIARAVKYSANRDEQKLKAREYYAANKEAVLAKQKTNRLETPEYFRKKYRELHAIHKASRNEQSRNYRRDNPEKWKAINHASKVKRKEEIAAYMAEWRKNNQDLIKAFSRSYREENGDVLNERTRKWRAENPVAYRMSKAERRAAELMATPKWADMSAIRVIYAEAVRLSKETGVPHHVDHEVPLRGKLVCGLHVHFNLRAIPALDNIRKSNQFEVS